MATEILFRIDGYECEQDLEGHDENERHDNRIHFKRLPRDYRTETCEQPGAEYTGQIDALQLIGTTCTGCFSPSGGPEIARAYAPIRFTVPGPCAYLLAELVGHHTKERANETEVSGTGQLDAKSSHGPCEATTPIQANIRIEGYFDGFYTLRSTEVFPFRR